MAAIVILVVLPTEWLDRIWSGEQRYLISLALASTALQYDVWPVATQMPEAQRKTVSVQLLYIFALLLQLFVIVGLYFCQLLSLESYFAANAILWLFVSVLAARLYDSCPSDVLKRDVRLILLDYAKFCSPIAPFLIIGCCFEFLDRWMLQNWAGSKQQAYFAIAQQFSSVSLLITASAVKIFWKDIAEALHDEDKVKAYRLYSITKKNVYFLSAFIASGLIPWHEELVIMLFGREYIAAGAVLVLMLLYSVHQALGQLEGAFILASGLTKIGMWFNYLMVPFGPLASYALLSPTLFNQPGLSLGAEGFAVKLLIFQIISVNALGYFICFKLRWAHEWRYQFAMLLYLLTIGFIGKAISMLFGFTLLPSLLVGAFVYVFLVCGAIFTFPKLFYVQDTYLEKFINVVRKG